MTMLFLKYSWSLRMAVRVSYIAKFGFASKIDLKHVSFAYTKKLSTPGPKSWPWWSRRSPRPLRLPWTPPKPKKSDFPWKIWSLSCLLSRYYKNWGCVYFFLMTKCSCFLEMTSKLYKNPKFRFCLKNWPISTCLG